ncbi:Acetyltransferase [anaerobic digester metagenome]
MEIVRFTSGQPEYTALSRQIRYQVFVEEQQVPEALEYDEFEDASLHYLVFADDKAIATCRRRETSKGKKLERFAVIGEARGLGAGELMVRHLLQEVLPLNRPVYLHAQVQVAGFYSKYGFVTNGPRFEEAGIDHYLMIYKKEESA